MWSAEWGGLACGVGGGGGGRGGPGWGGCGVLRWGAVFMNAQSGARVSPIWFPDENRHFVLGSRLPPYLFSQGVSLE